MSQCFSSTSSDRPRLVGSRPPIEVVELLNRFFAVVVEEVDRHRGIVNKFEGDATLAVFGAPVTLDNPEDDALAAARTIVARLRTGGTRMPRGHRGGGRAGGGRQRRAPTSDSSTP